MQLSRRTKIILKVVFRTLPNFPFNYKDALELIREVNNTNKDLDEKIDNAYESLKDTSILLEELQESLTERTEKVKFLREEYERFSQLSELKEDEAKVLLDQLELTLNKSRSKERWVGFLISTVSGLVIFILGIFAGPYLTKMIFGS